MKVPPPGSNATDIAEYIDRLVREAALDRYRLDAEIRWDRGAELYQGLHFTTGTPVGEIRIVLNRILNCIISQMAIQAGDPPKVTFTARETGEPPLYFLNTKLPQAKIAAAEIAQAALAKGSPWDPSQPVPDDEVEFINARIAQDQQARAMAQQAGLPEPVESMPENMLVEITDHTCAEALQTIFDAQWESQDLQFPFAENILNKNIFGHQPTLYEFDDDAKQHLFTNIHVKQVFLDPIQSDMRRAQYAIYDEPISAEEAKSLYPWLAQKIDDSFKEGQPIRPGSGNYSQATQYQQNFLRDMGYIRHAWIRSQPYPMTPEEAAEAGKVNVQEVADESAIGNSGSDQGISSSPVPNQAGIGNAPDLGRPSSGTDTPLNGELVAGGDGNGGVYPGDGGEAVDNIPPQPPTRQAYLHPDTGEELTPTLPDGNPHPQWPMRYGIRQLRIIAGECVDDRECEFADIPITNNINIPIPYSPYGLGEPHRLEGLQMALNYTLSAIVTHQRYNAFPPEVVAESVVDRLDEALKQCRAKPGQRLVIPDDLLTTFGDIKKIINTLDTATVPPDFWKLVSFLVDMIDKEGNQSDVMSGNAAPGWSGDAIASLQNAASQVIKAKSMMTEQWLRRNARLVAHSIINRMGPKDWLKYCSKYPLEAMQALHDRAKCVECDISIQIQSGSGAAKQSQTNNLIAARQSGIPISDPEIMDRLGVDPDTQMTKQAAFVKKQQAMMPQMPQPVQAPPAAQGKPAA